MHFQPSPQVPALQYIGSVEPGGAADQAGLCTGDFLIEVSLYWQVVYKKVEGKVGVSWDDHTI